MIKKAIFKTSNMLKVAIPMICGILLLINLINPLFQEYYPKLFTGNYFIDPIIGALAGSIAFGIPITAYITGGELLTSGISLLAVTAFILAWTTVGVAMLPLEIKYFGRKFAILRNIMNFFIAIIIATLTVLTLKLIT